MQLDSMSNASNNSMMTSPVKPNNLSGKKPCVLDELDAYWQEQDKREATAGASCQQFGIMKK